MDERIKNGLFLIIGAGITQGYNTIIDVTKINAEKEIRIEQIRAGVPNNNKNIFTADTLNTAKSLMPQEKKE